MIPDWMPKEAFDAYLAMRKTIKKPATEYAIKLVIGKLDGWRLEGYDVEAILNQSIEMSWQGVFPVRGALPAGKCKFDPVAYVNRGRK